MTSIKESLQIEGSIELTLGTSHEMAMTFAGLPTMMGSIRVLKGVVYFYDEKRWRVTEPWELRDAVSVFMGFCWLNLGKGRTAWVDATTNKVNSVVKCLEGLLRLDNDETPAWLGEGECRWSKKFSVSLLDVIVDLKASQERGEWVTYEKSREWFDTVVMPFTFQQMLEAPTPVFDQTVDQWSGGDADWTELLLRMTGYAAMPYRGFQRAFLMVGKKRGGKGTWTRIMNTLLGDDNIFSMDLEQVAYSHGLVGAEGKRQILINEVGETGFQIKGTIRRYLNSLIGMDKSKINHKGGYLYGSVLPGVVIMVGNDLPDISDETNSFWSKVCILPYDNSFINHENYDLEDQLKAELPGIGRKVLEAAVRLIAAGPAEKWPKPKGEREKRSRITRLNSPVGAFLESRCKFNSRMSVTKDDLFGEYLRWADFYEQAPLARNAFFRKLWDSGYPVREYRSGPSGNQTILVAGVGLDPEKEERL